MTVHIIFSGVVLVALLVLVVFSIKTSYEFAELLEAFEEILIQLEKLQKDNHD